MGMVKTRDDDARTGGIGEGQHSENAAQKRGEDLGGAHDDCDSSDDVCIFVWTVEEIWEGVGL